MRQSFGEVEAPQDWLSLRLPEQESELDVLVITAIESGLPLDVTSGKLVWGSRLENSKNLLVGFGTGDFHRANSADDACILVSAQIVEWLSCLNGKTLDVLFLPDHPSANQDCWAGAMEALEIAREDGLIRFYGLEQPSGQTICHGHPDLIAEPEESGERQIIDPADSREYRLRPVSNSSDVTPFTTGVAW